MAFTGRGNGERRESPQSGHLLAQAPSFLVMGSKMQQVTAATAGFEHAQVGTAETHLAKEILCLAAFSQTKLPLPFPGREGARRGNETPGRVYPKVLSPKWGLPDCLAGSREPSVPGAEVSAPGPCPELSVTACSLPGQREQAELGAGSNTAPGEQRRHAGVS